MTYEIVFEQRATYLYARVSGTNDQDTIIQYLQEVAEKCANVECFHVLIHECLAGPRLTTMDLFDTLSAASRKVMGKFDTVAYVDEEMGDLMRFGENIAVNRGFPIAAFTNIGEAIIWIELQSRDSKKSGIFHLPTDVDLSEPD